MSSVTSCPQCSRQVTIPAGVGTSATVRCPLCHAQYSLADALVNMPPLLELVDDAATGALGLAPEPGDQDELRTHAGIAETLEFTPREDFEDDAPPEFDDLAEPATISERDELSPGEPLGDELHMEEKDTEVEELSFTTSDPVVRAVPDDSEPIDLASDEDSVLEFDSHLTPGVDAGTPRRADADDPAATIDFDDMSAMDDETKFDAEDAAPTAAADDDEMVFEMAEGKSADAAGDEDLELDFQPAGESAGDEEEVSLDFGDPVEPEASPLATAVAAGGGEEETAEDAKGKKKKKKEKTPAEPGKKRSLSTVLSVVLGAVVAVPLALYFVLWLGPSFDVLGIASMLPNSILPSSFNKQYAVRRPVTPPPQLPSEPESPDPSAPAEPGTEPPAAEGAGTPAPEAAAPTTEEPSAEAPAKTEPPATEPEQPAAAPAEEPANEPAPSEPAPAEERPAAPSVDPFAETAKGDAEAKEMPAKSEAPPAEPSPVPDAPAPAAEPAADATTKPAPSEELPSPADSATPAPPPAEPATTEALGPIAPQVVGVAELAKALSDATVADQRMVAAIATGNEAEIKKVRSTFYLSLFRLAEVATFAKDDAGNGQLDTLRQSLEQLVRQLGADAKRTDSLKYNAGVWFEYPKRSTHGIVLAGKVVSAAPQGRLHEIKLDISLNSHAPVVTVLSAADAGLSVGDHALVVGTIIENPREQVAGYEGTEPAVVWNTMMLKDAAQ